jgi:hypothetical protein
MAKRMSIAGIGRCQRRVSIGKRIGKRKGATSGRRAATEAIPI